MKLAAEALSHATFDTPDIDRMIDYYADAIGLVLAGREKGRAYLYTVTGGPAITLVQAAAPRVSGIAFVVNPEADFAAAQEMLTSKYQLSSQMRSDVMPNVGDMLSFKDINGIDVDLITDIKREAPDRTPRDFIATRLGHVAFMTPDHHASVALYEDLGFKVADWRADIFAWMRCAPDHHVVDFIKHERVKLHHVAFEVKDASEILRACDSLGRKGHKLIYGPGRHIIADNIFTYHRNPDGQIVEIFTEMAKIESERFGEYGPRPWHQETPYKPRVWPLDTPGNLWGPSAPAGFSNGSDN